MARRHGENEASYLAALYRFQLLDRKIEKRGSFERREIRDGIRGQIEPGSKELVG